MAIRASASVTLCTVRDIKATYRFYKLQSSTANPPSRPTSIGTFPPSGWDDTEPGYSEGSTNSLYTVDLTVFTDNTFSYSDVSLSSSYEAAKDAYNKASAAQGSVTKLTDKTSSLENTVDGLTNKVSSVETTVSKKADGSALTAVDTRVNTLTNTVNGLSSTVSGVQTTLSKKADGSALTTTNSKVATLEQTVNGINSTVSSVSSTANTALSNANSAKADINNLKVGGRNLLYQYVRAGGSTTKVDSTKIKIGTIVADTYFYLKVHQALKNGEIYTISCEASNVPSGCNWYFGVTTQGHTWSLPINKNGLCYATGTPKVDVSADGEIILDDSGGRPTTAPNIILTNFKLEKGNKATDWTPAPEDVDESIAKVDGKFANYSTTTEVNSAINQKADSITSSVSSTYATKASVATVDGKFANYSTTAQVNSAIDQKANSITSSVSSTYATKTTVNAKMDKNIPDTRSDNQPPNWYFTNYPRQTITEFKFANIVGIGSSSVYGTLETKVPWSDSSGGYPVQTFRSQSTSTYERRGTGASTWGSWKEIEDTASAQAKANAALNSAKGYTNSSITTAKSEIKQTTDAINLEVSKKVGTSEIISKINQSAESISISASKINLSGAVTISALESGLKNTINTASTNASNAATTANTAKTTANTASSNASSALTKATTAISTADTASKNASNAVSTANTANSNASSAVSTANSANSAASSANTKIANWCYNNDTTYINGGKIYTGSITADKIAANAITADKFYGTAITSLNYVKDSAGTKIDLANGSWDSKNFKVKSDGSVSSTGMTATNITLNGGIIQTYHDNGNKGINIKNGLMNIYSYAHKDNIVGIIGSDPRNVSDTSQAYIMACDIGDRISIDYGMPIGNSASGTAQQRIAISRANTVIKGANANEQSRIELDESGHIHVRPAPIGPYTHLYGTTIIEGTLRSYPSSPNVTGFVMVDDNRGKYLAVNGTGFAYGVTAWTSDIRLKHNINDTSINGVDTIRRFRHRQFTWNNTGLTTGIGFISQELRAINKDFVFEVGGYYQPNEATIIPTISKALQETIERDDRQDDLIEKLKNENIKLKERLLILENKEFIAQ